MQLSTLQAALSLSNEASQLLLQLFIEIENNVEIIVIVSTVQLSPLPPGLPLIIQ